MTFSDIYQSDRLPESFWHIASGSAIVYVSSAETAGNTLRLMEKLVNAVNSRFPFFQLTCTVETTEHEWLHDRIVARRVSMGSLFQYGLLSARLDSEESVDAFVREYFHFGSRDDQELLLVAARVRYKQSSYSRGSSFGGMSFMQMVVRRDEDDSYADDSGKSPEQLKAEEKIRQLVLAYCSQYHRDPDPDVVMPLASGRFVVEDDAHPCRLVITDDRELILEAGTYVTLDLTALQKTFYCLLLETPDGVEIKRMDEYYDRLCSLYDFFNRSQNGRDDSPEAIENLCTMVDDGRRYRSEALTQLVSKANRRLRDCLMRDAVIDDFAIQNADGRYFVKLPQEKVEYTAKSTVFANPRKKH